MIEVKTVDYEKWFEMEEKYSLFDIKTEEGIYIWDIMRWYVNRYIYIKYTRETVSTESAKSFRFYYKGMLIIIGSFFSWITKKRNNIIFSISRNLDRENMLYDIICDDIINLLQDDIIIIDRRKALPEYRYTIEYNLVNLIKRIFISKKLSIDIFNTISHAMQSSFGEMQITYNELNKFYEDYQKEYKYYRFYFKWKKPKRIFICYDEKSVIAAAHSLKIPVLELQHSYIGRYFIGFSYPNIITKHDKRTIYPDYMLTFSDYWGKEVNTPFYTYSIGNTYFSTETDKLPANNGSILVISNMIHGEILSQIILQYMQKFPDVHINFKLHPHEFKITTKYKEFFQNQKNITVLKNEIAMNVLIAQSNIVVLIDSSTFYEVLNIGAKAAVYKVMSYKNLSNCFSHPNVYLFDTIDELHNAYIAEKKENNITFFDKFNAEKLTSLLNEIKS
ncbi:MAG: hypothetical protein LBD59_11260 [Prevotellaceae bacterium]|jgi:hypothetical protein|nr:hypothetical protein [Prevotellaceae bacterium]